MVVTTIAGIPGVAGAADGPASSATFNRPTWLDVNRGGVHGNRGDIVVVDRANSALRIVSGGRVLTPKFAYSFANPAPFPFEFGGPFGGGIAIEPEGAGCGGGEYDSGLWVATTASRQIALLSLVGRPAARDDIAPFVGLSGGLTMPTGLALSTPYGGGYRDAQKRSLYIADSGDHTVKRVGFQLSFEACPQHKILEKLAGTSGVAGWQDGAASTARFNAPRGLVTANDGSVYVADSGNHVIRRIAAGVVTTVAGEPGVPGDDDHHLNTPAGIEVRFDGTLFIADTGNHTIRMLAADGTLITIAGRAGVAGHADGSGTDARFAGPVGLKFGTDGGLYVADTSNHVVRRVAFVEPDPRRRSVRR